MKLINYTNPRILIADEGKKIRSKNDVYKEAYIDENGNKIEEHFPYYSTVIFPGAQIQTLDQAQEIYEEVGIDEENS